MCLSYAYGKQFVRVIDHVQIHGVNSIEGEYCADLCILVMYIIG